MLPGFRFLFVAIVLSMSILVFGLGAAALLRAAHEEFANNPSRRAAPEAMFAQQSDAARPVLAMLRIEPQAAEQKASDDVPAVAEPAKPEVGTSQPTEPDKVAALKPEETSPPEAARPEIPRPKSPAQSEAAQPLTGAPAVASETKVAAADQPSPPPQVFSPANEAMPAVSEPADASASSAAGSAPTKTAALDGPTVAIATLPPAKADSTPPERSAIEKRQQARRAAHRRRMAARARQARLEQQQSQQTADPFAQAFLQPPPAAARH